MFSCPAFKQGKPSHKQTKVTVQISVWRQDDNLRGVKKKKLIGEAGGQGKARTNKARTNKEARSAFFSQAGVLREDHQIHSLNCLLGLCQYPQICTCYWLLCLCHQIMRPSCTSKPISAASVALRFQSFALKLS